MQKIIARDHVFYNKQMFRAFLNYTSEDLEEMTMQEFIDNQVLLQHVLKMWHAPYLKHD